MNILSQQQCLLFYTDIMSILSGMFQGGEQQQKYIVHVLGKTNDRVVVFSSKRNSLTYEDTDQWIESSGVYKAFDIASLDYKPNIYQYQDEKSLNKKDIVQHFCESQRINNILREYQVYSNPHDKVFVVFLVIEGIKTSYPIPALLDDLTSRCIVKWRDCFYNADICRLRLHEGLLMLRPNGSDAIAMLHSHPDYINKAIYFDIVAKISGEYYEKKKSIGSIAITPQEYSSNYIDFEPVELISCNVRYLRKLLEMTHNEYSLLVYKQKAYGIGISYNAETIFHIKGHLEWEMLDNNKPILGYRNGNYFVPQDWDNSDWFEDKYFSVIASESKIILTRIIKEIWNFQVGALLIFSPMAKREARRLSKYKRGQFLETPIKLSTENYKETLQAITSIDGAVMIDDNCQIHGYGIIVDGDAVVVGTAARGARFNSPKNYLNRYVKELEKPAFAVVISDDRTIDILYADEPAK